MHLKPQGEGPLTCALDLAVEPHDDIGREVRAAEREELGALAVLEQEEDLGRAVAVGEEAFFFFGGDGGGDGGDHEVVRIVSSDVGAAWAEV